MEIQQVIALGALVGVFLLFATRLLHRAVAALAGALVLAVGLGMKTVLGEVVPEVLIVTAGLLVLTGFVKRSGLASWLTLAAAKAARGRPGPLLWWAGILTFVGAAALGPLAAVVLVVPVALLLALELDISATPFVMVLSWTAILGGATVPTAQPGNLWVAAVLGVDPATWVFRMAPLTVSALVATLGTASVVYRKSLRVTNERRARVLEYDIGRSIEDRGLLTKTLVVLALVAAGLVTSQILDLPPSVTVAAGAVLLLLWDGPRAVDKSLAEIDWGTLAFYGGLTAVVGTFGATGIPRAWASTLAVGPLSLLWGTAVLGAFFDHGAVAGGLVPFLQAWAAQPGLWTFVVLGSSLGAGTTVWGATSNAAAVALAGQGTRAPTWRQFTGWGLVFGAVNLVVVSALTLVLYR